MSTPEKNSEYFDILLAATKRYMDIIFNTCVMYGKPNLVDDDATEDFVISLMNSFGYDDVDPSWYDGPLLHANDIGCGVKVGSVYCASTHSMRIEDFPYTINIIENYVDDVNKNDDPSIDKGYHEKVIHFRLQNKEIIEELFDATPEEESLLRSLNDYFMGYKSDFLDEKIYLVPRLIKDV